MHFSKKLQNKLTFMCWIPKYFRSLYTAFVRPNMEYAAPVIQEGDRECKDSYKPGQSIQEPGLYLDRLKKLKLSTLEERRLRSDLVQF